MALFSEPDGQYWPQICQLLLTVGLSALIGIERQFRQKADGLRTNTLVRMGSALFMLVSKYGFMDILSRYHVVADPSRIATQIVSGIGFIGGGIIFKKQSDVRGLTTAAAVWLTAAVGDTKSNLEL
ncbi:Mg2+ transporter MgtC family protein [Penicillium lagena]|uniref:Mg2+ transporter MgtC family protein n=1 Tax=Penicillium lagena TaxID=94218 RepID=UPI00253FBEAC|nr:Mg2+ transporter MgtC family protein [Penicillium lagena]KAJ5611112.1 Mg2+ transporter MgtC family protein [Penicillium lagena]